MTKTLKNLIESYKNGTQNTSNLQIIYKKFLNETICDERLFGSTFKKVNLTNVNFTNVNFKSSFFQDCVFKDCIFDSTALLASEFKNCSLVNCQIKDCELAKSVFTRTTFDKCQFARTKNGGGLAKGWFESCHFLETTFDGFRGISIMQTAVVDSKFTKFNKSIEFQGEFFLRDILYSVSGIDQMFIK